MGTRLRTFVWALAIAVAMAACNRNKSKPTATLPPPPAVPQVDGGLTLAPNAGAPRALVVANRLMERLTPDRRFLIAFEHVDRILGGVQTGPFTAKLGADGQWSIASITGAVVATLPDAPDFEPLMDALSKYAATRVAAGFAGKGTASSAKDVDVPLAHQAFAVLTHADDEWKKPATRPAAARHAGTALIGLCFGVHDKLEVVDELPARAIATTAVARALDARLAPSVEALLARVLGYGAAAIRLAPAATNDAVAAYAAADDERLFPLARSSGFARQAWLRRLVLREDLPASRAWIDHELVRQRGSIPVLAAQSMVAQQLETYRFLSGQFPLAALAEAKDASTDLANESGPAHRISDAAASKPDAAEPALVALGTSSPKVLLAYDEAVAALPKRSGTFRDEKLDQDYLDLNMVAGMTAIERFLVYAFGSPKETVRTLNALAEPTNLRTKAFRTYFSATAASSSGGAVGELVAHVTAKSLLGGRARYILLDATYGRLMEPATSVVARGLLKEIDSRPGNRTNAGWLMSHVMVHARAAEDFYRSSAKVGGGADANVDAAILERDRDPEAVLAFARRASAPPARRAHIVGWAMGRKLGDQAALAKVGDDLMRDAPVDWHVRSPLVWAYNRTDPAHARSIMQDFLDRKAGGANGGLGEVAPRIALAESLRDERKYEEALSVMTPVAETWQGGALGEIAVLNAEAGHHAEAEKFALRALERYPRSVTSAALLARIRWMKGDMTGAAAALTAWPRPLNGRDAGYYVAPLFGYIFWNKPDEAPAATKALLTAKLGQVVAGAASWLIHRKAYPAALAVLEPTSSAFFTTPRTNENDEVSAASMRVLTFEATLAVKGRDAAFSLLRKEIGTSDRVYAETMYEAFRLNRFEVLELEIPASINGETKSEAWTLRLAAQLKRDGKVTIANEARAVFKTQPTARYSVYGSYLLGDADADAIERFATSPKQTCEVAYHMALKAIGEGRHADAVDFLRVTLDTRSTRDGEYVFAEGDTAAYFAPKRALAQLPPGLPDLPFEVVPLPD